jgi:PAS domain S-box-containing protein
MPLAAAAPLAITEIRRVSPTRSTERYAGPFIAYTLAVFLSFAAVLVQQSLPLGVATTPFLLLVLAVLISAQVGGVGPGLLATLLGAMLGRYHLLALSAVAAPEGSVSTGVFVGVATVVSLLGARAHASRRETRRQRELYAALGEAAPDLIWSCDREGRPDYLSGGWQEFTGKRHLALKACSWEALVHPADLEQLCARMAEVVRDGRRRDLECRFWRHDGEGRWFWTRIAPIKDSVGRVIKLVGVSTDIEVRKRVEAQRELELTREHAERLRAEAEAELRDRTMAVLSHDLRQPLCVIEASVALFKKRDLVDKRELAAVELISRNVRRIDGMIRDLLDYARVGSTGVIPVAPNRADLGEICRRAVEDARTELPGRALVLHAQDQLVGSWDAERVQQVLANLIGNALRHGRDDRPVRVTAWREDEAAIIEVHNEGAPIPATLHRAIFEPFQRGPKASERHSSGLGLGLFIAHEIVRGHGGTVDVCSTALEGTTFRVRLPFRAAEASSGQDLVTSRGEGSVLAFGHPRDAVRMPGRTSRAAG